MLRAFRWRNAFCATRTFAHLAVQHLIFFQQIKNRLIQTLAWHFLRRHGSAGEPEITFPPHAHSCASPRLAARNSTAGLGKHGHNNAMEDLCVVAPWATTKCRGSSIHVRSQEVAVSIAYRLPIGGESRGATAPPRGNLVDFETTPKAIAANPFGSMLSLPLLFDFWRPSDDRWGARRRRGGVPASWLWYPCWRSGHSSRKNLKVDVHFREKSTFNFRPIQSFFAYCLLFGRKFDQRNGNGLEPVSEV